MEKPLIIKLKEYEKCYNKLDKSIQRQVDRQEKILENTGGKGKPLYKNILFERKVGSYRIYYLKKDNNKIILVLILIRKKSGDKKQQEVIDQIIKLLLPKILDEITDF